MIRKRFGSILILLTLLFSLATPCDAVQSLQLTSKVPSDAITLDGSLSEAVWSKAESFSFPLQTDQDCFGSIQFLYNDTGLYLSLIVVESSLAFCSDTLQDGLLLQMENASRKDAAFLSYRGQAYSDSLSVTSSAWFDDSSACYTIEALVAFPAPVRPGDTLSLTASLQDLQRNGDPASLSPTFGSLSFRLQLGSKPAEEGTLSTAPPATEPPAPPEQNTTTPSPQSPSVTEDETTTITAKNSASSSKGTSSKAKSSSSSTTKPSAKASGSSSKPTAKKEEQLVLTGGQMTQTPPTSPLSPSLLGAGIIALGILLVVAAVVMLLKADRKTKSPVAAVPLSPPSIQKQPYSRSPEELPYSDWNDFSHGSRPYLSLPRKEDEIF